MKKYFWIPVILLLAAGGVAVGVKTYQKATSQPDSAGNARKKGGAETVAVEIVEPRQMTVRDLRGFSGTLKAWSVYDVAPKISGRLLKLPFNIGDPVPAGAVIAQIDPIEYQQQLDQIAADLEVAQAQAREAEVVGALRKQEFERQETLLAKSIGSRAQYESAQSALLAQMATIAMKQAEVKRARASLENARTKLDETTLRANWPEGAQPRYVGDRYVDEGELLAANRAIVSIAEIDRLRAAIYVIESDYPHLKLGQKAELTTDAYPDRTFNARVAKISQTLQENSRQAYVLLEIPNADLKLKPGMFVRVQLEFARHENAIAVPLGAIVKRGGKTGVYRISLKEKKAYFTEVKTGIVFDDWIEIVSPRLKYPVATLGNHLLANGTSVLLPQKDGAAR